MADRSRAVQVTDRIHQVAVGQVNVFLLTDGDDLVLVDAGFPGKADVILGAVAELGRQPGDLKHIVLTHAHPDHVGSAAALVTATGAQTWMHRLDAPIAEGREPFRPVRPAPHLTNRVLHFVLSRVTTSVEPVHVDHHVEDGQVLPFADGLTAVHAPGHCAGQVALHWPDQRAVFAADVCGNNRRLGPPLG